MPDILTFTMAAPLAGMGELAVGERRGSWERPGRSAVLGLLAACLGLDRADEAAHLALEAELGLALRLETCGPLLADYHTAQAPPARRNRRFATRAQELAALDLNTILSRRDYRVDLVAFAAVWARDPSPRWTLSALAEALRAPRYTPYFGRKSCPFMLPFAPRIAAAEEPLTALSGQAQAHEAMARRHHQWTLLSKGSPTVTMDAADARAFGLPVARVELRRDRIASRRRWQFGLREEAVMVMP